LFLLDECDQQTECNCLRKFRNDEHHQYILSNSHRLIPTQRLDLISLMQNNLNDTNQLYLHDNIRLSSSSNSSIITDDIDCTTKLTCLTDGFRRKKSASLNSPANSGK